MFDRTFPPHLGPLDPEDLPDVFADLIAIDIVEGELLPRLAQPPRRAHSGPS